MRTVRDHLHVFAWLAVLVLAQACGPSQLNAAIQTSNAAAHALTTSHQQLTTMRREAQLRAARAVEGDRSDPVVQVQQLDAAREVGRRFRPAWAAYSAARAAWLSVVGILEVAIDGGPVGARELAGLLGQLAGAKRDLEIAIGHLKGADLDDAPPPAPEESR